MTYKESTTEGRASRPQGQRTPSAPRPFRAESALDAHDLDIDAARSRPVELGEKDGLEAAQRQLSADIKEGILLVNSLHTTCALFVNEFQGALVEDLKAMIESLVTENAGYRHDDPRYSDCERGNAHSHLRAALLGRSVALGISGGELSLGRFQSILFAELDGPRPRSVDVQIMGV